MSQDNKTSELVSDTLLKSKYNNHSTTISSKNMTSLFRHLEGSMLTIVEASVVDPEQRRAVKSIVKDRLWNDIYAELQEWMGEQTDGNGSSFPF